MAKAPRRTPLAAWTLIVALAFALAAGCAGEERGRVKVKGQWDGSLSTQRSR